MTTGFFSLTQRPAGLAAGNDSPALLKRVWGLGRTIIALDAQTGKIRWKHDVGSDLDARYIAVRDSNVFYLAISSHAGALDADNGKVKWKNESKELLDAVSLPGAFGHSSLGSLQPCVLAGKGLLSISGKGRKNLVVISAETGKMIGALPGGRRFNSIFEGGDLYVEGLGKLDSADLHAKQAPKKKDPSQFGWSVSGCGPITASPNVFCGRHGVEWDRIGNLKISDAAYRSGCWQDSFVAHGQLWNTPYTCGCNYLTRGFNILAPLSQPLADSGGLLEKGKSGDSATPPASPLDWPTSGASQERTGASRASVPSEAKIRWSGKFSKDAIMTQSIEVADSIYLAGDDGIVLCLNLKDGKEKWSFPTGGSICQSVTYDNGKIYAGSSDGHAYCIDAGSGELVWRFRGAPAERRIHIYGKLMSAWPCLSGILLKNGVAYAAFGFVDRDGTWVYAIDAKSGALKWKNFESGHIVDKDSRKGATVSGMLTVAGGVLWMASGNKVNPVGYRLEDGKTVLAPYVSADAYDPIPRGSYIGAFSEEMLIHGGTPIHSSQSEWIKDSARGNDWAFCRIANSTPQFPELILTRSQHPPVWNGKYFASECIRKKQRSIECWSIEKTCAYLKENYPTPKAQNHKKKGLSFEGIGMRGDAPLTYPMLLWKSDAQFLYGLAMAENALISLEGEASSKKEQFPGKWKMKAHPLRGQSHLGASSAVGTCLR